MQEPTSNLPPGAYDPNAPFVPSDRMRNRSIGLWVTVNCWRVVLFAAGFIQISGMTRQPESLWIHLMLQPISKFCLVLIFLVVPTALCGFILSLTELNKPHLSGKAAVAVLLSLVLIITIPLCGMCLMLGEGPDENGNIQSGLQQLTK